ncbi:MAG: hypothetical protein GY865_07910 [candidate division Zixibacteria bacterium]|nr:hypothetical protein [candidate division Zixibacteria bacterium]
MTKQNLYVILVIIVMIFSNLAYSYEIPQRKIEIKPYINFLSANDLFVYKETGNIVKNNVGIGGGLKLRTQISGKFGYILNASFNSHEVLVDGTDFIIIFIGGLYYSHNLGFTDFKIDAGYGFLTAGSKGTGVFMPTLELSRELNDRIALAFEIGWPISNDWFYDYDIQRHYSSFTFSLGTIFIF